MKYPFIVAEMSGNHNQSLERALAIVDAVAKSGANAIKIQTYTADTITMPNVYTIKDPQSLWYGRDLYDLYQEAHTPWEWHQAIYTRAKEKGIICFSTPFDETAVDFLEKLDNPIYKIASFEVNHIPLLKKVAQTGKPVIMSTGVSTLAEIEEAVQTLKENRCNDLTLLKCTSTYPARPENTNLLTVPHMRQLFNCNVGLSDHTLGIGVAVASIALGANIIEKHFCLSRAEGGVDSAFSLEPQEMKLLVEEVNRVYQALGKVSYGILDAEKNNRIFKRSIYAAKDIKVGDVFTSDNVKVIRPGDGLHPRYFEKLLNQQAITNIKKGTPLTELLSVCQRIQHPPASGDEEVLRGGR
jgi:N-acetylneuraminate synthase